MYLPIIVHKLSYYSFLIYFNHIYYDFMQMLQKIVINVIKINAEEMLCQ